MRIHEKIKLRRTELGLTVSEVAKYIGKSAATVYRYESEDIETLPVDILPKLAKVLKSTPEWLLGWETQPTDNSINIPNIPNIIPMPKTKKVPLLGTVACGEPIFADEQHGEYIDCLDGISADFCLKCKGDSMINARIYDGDVVFIKKQPTVENGQIGCVLIGDDATLKYIYIKEDKVILRPANPLYDDMVYAGEDINNIKILGRAVIGSYSIK